MEIRYPRARGRADLGGDLKLRVIRKMVDLAARATPHVGLHRIRNFALLAPCLITLSPGQGVADPEEALLRCVARHGQAAVMACDEAASSDLEPAERGAAQYYKGLALMSLGRYEDAARA